MKKKERYIYKNTIYMIVIIFWVGISITIMGNKLIKSVYKNINIINLDSNWLNNINKDYINLPITIKCMEEEKLIIEKNISTEGYTNPTLLIRNELQSIDIIIDGSYVKKIRKSDKQLFGKEAESDWTFVEIPVNKKDVQVKLVFSSEYYGYNGKINGIILGDKSDEIIYIIANGSIKLFSSIVLLSIGIFLIFIYIGSSKYSDLNYKIILYLGFINVITALRTLLDSKILELFISDVIPRGEIKIVCIFLLPVVFLKFVMKTCKAEYINILNLKLKLILSYIVVSSILHMLNIIHYMESIIIFHGLCIVIYILCMIISIKDMDSIKSYDIKIYLGIILLATTGFLDLVLYYNYGQLKYNNLFEWTIITCNMIFAYYSGKKAKQFFYVGYFGEKNVDYRYIDSLTGLLNRMAFDIKMYEINRSLKEYLGYSLFVFNLNNLKKINDTLGYFEGNRYIKNNVNVLLNIFESYGELYRINADEFVLIANRRIPISKCEEKLHLYVERTMPERKIDLIGISYGYSKITNKNINIYQVLSKAEMNMIKLKNRLKQSNIR